MPGHKLIKLTRRDLRPGRPLAEYIDIHVNPAHIITVETRSSETLVTLSDSNGVEVRETPEQIGALIIEAGTESCDQSS